MQENNIYNGYSLCFNAWALDTEIKNELPLLQIISSLSAKYGYCIASNEYLAELFKTTPETISRKINKLEKKHYISIEYKKNGCTIEKRFIRLTNISTDDYQKYQPTIDKNVKDNITSNNITKESTINSTKESLSVFSKDVSDSIEKWLQYKKEKRQAYKPTGLKTLLKRLEKEARENGDKYIIDAIDHSIECNYSGIYPPRTYQQKKDEYCVDRDTAVEEIQSMFVSIDDLDDIEI